MPLKKMKCSSDQTITIANNPAPNDWQNIIRLASSFDGWEVFGNECGGMANQVESSFKETGVLPAGLSLDELRNAFFSTTERQGMEALTLRITRKRCCMSIAWLMRSGLK